MKPESRQPLTDAEREITNKIVQKFWKNDEVTSRRDLLRELKPLRSIVADALRDLVNRAVLNTVNNVYLEETFSPRAVAFYYCGDADALAFAKKSTELMLQVAQNLYDRELEGPAVSTSPGLFKREDAEIEAQKIDPTVTPDMVRVGLALAEEFGVFPSLQRDEQKKMGVMAFRPGPRVFELGENAWDEHIRRSRVSVERTWEREQVALSEDVPRSAGGFEVDTMPRDNRKIFLVHGHAEGPKESVSAFLRAIGLEVIILHEQPNKGQTIIEKLENHSNVAFAVVLLTPDDAVASAQNRSRRARQNVILELGYFLAKLGRQRVCCIYVDGVELPSDYHGVLYVPYDEKKAWRWKLVKELSAAGIEVDSQKLSTVSDLDAVVDIFKPFFAPKNK